MGENDKKQSSHFGLPLILTIILIIIGVIILNIFKNSEKDNELEYLNLEKKIYKIANIKPYKAYKVNFRKEPKNPNGIYFQYNYGCVLYSLINIGWLNEEDIPDSMKCYKDHPYSKDERTHQRYLIKLLSLLDLAQLWVNLGGETPYKNKETKKDIIVQDMRKKVYSLLKQYVEKKDKKFEDLKSAFNLASSHTTFVSVIGHIPVKPTLLSQTNFASKIEDLNLKNAIDKGYIVKNDDVCILGHYIVFKGIIKENNKDIYVFIDSQTDLYKKVKKEFVKGSNVDYDNGIIHAPENSSLLNIIESPKNRVGILELLFK